MSAPPYVWRVRAKLPERHGERCRILARSSRKRTRFTVALPPTWFINTGTRGGGNSVLVEFADGARFVTSANYVRRAP